VSESDVARYQWNTEDVTSRRDGRVADASLAEQMRGRIRALRSDRPHGLGETLSQIIALRGYVRDNRGRFARTGGGGGTYGGGGAAGPADSLASHTRADGSLTPERQRLHDELVAETLAGVPVSANPTVYMMGGGPASGKSMVINKGLVDMPGKGKAAYVNADDFKEKLPEYDQMIRAGKGDKAAPFVHEESSLLSKKALAAATAGKHDVVLDGTGDSSIESLSAKVASMRKNGHRVEATYVSLDTELAVSNAQARKAKTGRSVPEDVIRDTHASVSRVLPQALDRDLFDKVSLYDTNVNGSPRLVMTKEKGKDPVIHDRKLWNDFIAKG